MSMKSYCPLTKIEKGDDENDFLDGLNIQMRVFVFCPWNHMVTVDFAKIYFEHMHSGIENFKIIIIMGS
jgi:hypothetical protein